MKTKTSAPLIRNTLSARGNDFKTVRRELGRATLESKAASPDKNDRFAIKDRTMDQVVDCLLRELSW
jgi:hypothetical protein